jgi:small subunit ribosomal protein S2
MSNKTNPQVEAMFKAGAHFGYSKTRRHASMAPFIFTTKNRVDMIDLEKAEKSLEVAKEYLKSFAQGDKQVLFVGTKPEARRITQELAESIDMPYVVERWVGGVITNSPEIKKRITLLQDLQSKKEKGELEKYTKKERLLIDAKIAKMHKLFSGLVNLRKMPDALLVVDAKKEHIAVTEAHKAHIPVISLINTDTAIKSVEFPVIGNDASVSSISFFLKALVDAYKSGKIIK